FSFTCCNGASDPEVVAGSLGRMVSSGGVKGPLLTKNRHTPGSACILISSFFVSLHQEGRSIFTVESYETISNSSPGSSGSMCLRINNSRPLPQSRTPPLKLVFGG